MTIKDLVTRRDRRRMPVRHRERSDLTALHDEVNRLFDDCLKGFGLTRPLDSGVVAGKEFGPVVDIQETGKDIRVTAELPGMDAKDIDVEVDTSTVTIRGEKRLEKEEESGDWFLHESSHGSFQRVLALPAAVETDQAKATFKKGMLKLTLPKAKVESSSSKRIEVRSDAA